MLDSVQVIPDVGDSTLAFFGRVLYTNLVDKIAKEDFSPRITVS